MKKELLNEDNIDFKASIDLNPISLSFRNEQSKLENKFLLSHLNNSLKSIRISIVFVFLLFAIFGILDSYIAPKEKEIF